MVQNKFPIGSYIVVHGNSWKKKDHPVSWWLKGRNAVVTGYHLVMEHDKDGNARATNDLEIEVAITKPDGKSIINMLFQEDEIELAETQRNNFWWE